MFMDSTMITEERAVCKYLFIKKPQKYFRGFVIYCFQYSALLTSSTNARMGISASPVIISSTLA